MPPPLCRPAALTSPAPALPLMLYKHPYPERDTPRCDYSSLCPSVTRRSRKAASMTPTTFSSSHAPTSRTSCRASFYPCLLPIRAPQKHWRQHLMGPASLALTAQIGTTFPESPLGFSLSHHLPVSTQEACTGEAGDCTNALRT